MIENQSLAKTLSKHDCFGNFILSNHVNHCLYASLLGMFRADLPLRTEPRFQGTTVNPHTRFVWSAQTESQSRGVAAASPTAAAIPEVIFRTTKSSWPKSTEHRQCTDRLAQAGLDRSDLHTLTDVHRRYTAQMSCFERRKQAGCIERPDGCSKRIVLYKR